MSENKTDILLLHKTRMCRISPGYGGPSQPGATGAVLASSVFNTTTDADGDTTVRTRIATAYATDCKTTYTWDYRNRLTDVDYYDNNAALTKRVHYVYGVFDHLLATEVDPNGGGTYTQIQHYVLGVSPEIPSAGVPGTALAQPVLEFDGAGNLIQRNLVALDPAAVAAVMAQEDLTQGGAVTWMADNNLGSPVDVVDDSGVLANHIVYSPFGQDIYESNVAVAHWAGFAGGHEDPNTGLVHDYERWYNPATGTWESRDPKSFAAGDANLDRYVGNDPTSLVDLSGLSPIFLMPQQQHAYNVHVKSAAAQQEQQEAGQEQQKQVMAAAAQVMAAQAAKLAKRAASALLLSTIDMLKQAQAEAAAELRATNNALQFLYLLNDGSDDSQYMIKTFESMFDSILDRANRIRQTRQHATELLNQLSSVSSP